MRHWESRLLCSAIAITLVTKEEVTINKSPPQDYTVNLVQVLNSMVYPHRGPYVKHFYENISKVLSPGVEVNFGRLSFWFDRDLKIQVTSAFCHYSTNVNRSRQNLMPFNVEKL